MRGSYTRYIIAQSKVRDSVDRTYRQKEWNVFTYKDEAVRIATTPDEGIIVERQVKRVGYEPIWVRMK